MLDSFGLGATADADKYGGKGRTAIVFQGKAGKAGVRNGPLHLPNLTRLGLNGAAMASTGQPVLGLDATAPIHAAYGCAEEVSLGKDTQSGHWEMAGVPVLFEWGYFPPDYPSFPKEIIDALIQQGKLSGVLGNRHASGTQIIEELGVEHQEDEQAYLYINRGVYFRLLHMKNRLD